jgi:hypothetical protein
MDGAKDMNKIPSFIAEFENERWGFSSSHELNRWVEMKSIDPKQLKVYSILPMAEEEWNEHVYDK